MPCLGLPPGCGASYVEVLTNETNCFTAELNLVHAKLNKLPTNCATSIASSWSLRLPLGYI